MVPAQALHGLLEHTLNGPRIGLPLPARESRTVILKHELQRPRFHSVKIPNWMDSNN
jgi:hypothetical protein